jgi:hypothetical protein
VCCECVEWIHLAQNTSHLLTDLYAVMKICVPQKSRELLSHIVPCSHAVVKKIEAAAYSFGEAAKPRVKLGGTKWVVTSFRSTEMSHALLTARCHAQTYFLIRD